MYFSSACRPWISSFLILEKEQDKKCAILLSPCLVRQLSSQVISCCVYPSCPTVFISLHQRYYSFLNSMFSLYILSPHKSVSGVHVVLYFSTCEQFSGANGSHLRERKYYGEKNVAP